MDKLRSSCGFKYKHTSFVAALLSGSVGLQLILYITEKFFKFFLGTHHKNNWTQKSKAMNINRITSKMEKKTGALSIAAEDNGGCINVLYIM